MAIFIDLKVAKMATTCLMKEVAKMAINGYMLLPKMAINRMIAVS